MLKLTLHVKAIVRMKNWREKMFVKQSSLSKKAESVKKDLTMTLPSRRTILRYLEDASYMSLKYVAQLLLNNDELVITIGLDDTTKAAGHKSYDIKTDHITIKGDSEQKKILTTGYIENLSHSG